VTAVALAGDIDQDASQLGVSGARGVLCQGVDVKYAWIEQHQLHYRIAPMCKLLAVTIVHRQLSG
jgi:hypothetical protein